MKVLIYDKWLNTLGGGEVVACSMAKILKDQGHDVTFVSGKEVSLEVIYEKLNIDLKKIRFKQVWNDENALKKLTRDEDLFINISFLDYSIGFAKKNIYYVNFPTKLYHNFKEMMLVTILVPLLTRFMKPIEFLNKIDAPVVIFGKPAYLLRNNNKFALSNLTPHKIQEVSFKIYLSNFYKSFLENFTLNITNAEVVDKTVLVTHTLSTIDFTVKFIPTSLTAYLNFNFNKLAVYNSVANEEEVYLFYPKIYLSHLPSFLFTNFRQRIATRLRAGIFANVSERLSTYHKVVTYSYFGWKWTRKYWRTDPIVIAPPVDLLFKKYKLSRHKKNNWICSVGRFFTLGHGKKQEILLEVFKKLCDKTHKKWELHLVGGLGDEPSSIDFFKYLKNEAKGYPVFFHINAPRQEVEEVYLKSKIYWHATGFGEEEQIHPIRFEHFGISPIEALSAKCIPILFNGGGLREIIASVKLDKEKNLFKTRDQLVDNTVYYQRNSNQKLDWDFIFGQLDKLYSSEAFKKNFLQLLSTIK